MWQGLLRVLYCSVMDREDLRNRFEYHPPKDDDTVNAHRSIRLMMLEAAEEIDRVCPEGREKSLAITHLETAMFWANAAIARQP